MSNTDITVEEAIDNLIENFKALYWKTMEDDSIDKRYRLKVVDKVVEELIEKAFKRNDIDDNSESAKDFEKKVLEMWNNFLNSLLIEAWIQLPDFSSTDFGKVDIDKALELYETFDWEKALQKEEHMNKKGEESCPPGLGLIHPKGHILHIEPRSKNNVTIHYMLKHKVKKFILFNSVKESDQIIDNLTNQDAIVHVKRFFDNMELDKFIVVVRQ